MSRLQNTDAEAQEVLTSGDRDRTAAASYRELFQIGSGGFATISVALAQGIEGFSKLVVLKTLREEISLQPGAATMFLDEARLMARMNHPNIVQVYEVFRRRGATVIVMEYVDGQSLSAVRAQGRETNSPLSLEFGIFILTKVLVALHYAHTLCDFSGEPLGLIHRDVSPQNVMVTYDGQVKLLDFGIAKLANSDFAAADQTRTGVIKGKLAYMAPEQFIGEVDHRVDIFAVGVMLWELAAGRRFWGGLPESTVMRRLISGDLPHLREHVDMDPELARICDQALSCSVEKRYPNAAAMRDDLERYLAERGVVVSQTAVGQFVSDTCTEARKRVQQAIRTHLSEVSVSGTRSCDISLSDSVRPESSVASISFSKPRWRTLAGVGALAALVLFVVGHFTRTPSSTSAAGIPGNPQPGSVSAGSVRLRGNTQPAGAVWYLDDRMLGPDPLDMRLPKDDVVHTLRAESDGYAPFTRSIRMEADMDIMAVLSQKPGEVAQHGGPSSPQTRRYTPAPRPIVNRSTPPSPVATPTVVEPPPPPSAAAAKTKKENGPVQFGESLKRTGTGTGDRERRGIDGDYPGGG